MNPTAKRGSGRRVPDFDSSPWIAEYFDACSRYGPNSEQTKRVRENYGNNEDFIRYADRLDRIKRQLGNSDSEAAPNA